MTNVWLIPGRGPQAFASSGDTYTSITFRGSAGYLVSDTSSGDLPAGSYQVVSAPAYFNTPDAGLRESPYWLPQLAGSYEALSSFGAGVAPSISIPGGTGQVFLNTQDGGWQRAYIVADQNAIAGIGDPNLYASGGGLVPENHLNDAAYAGLGHMLANFGGYSAGSFLDRTLSNPGIIAGIALTMGAAGALGALGSVAPAAESTVTVGAESTVVADVSVAAIPESVITPTVAASAPAAEATTTAATELGLSSAGGAPALDVTAGLEASAGIPESVLTPTTAASGIDAASSAAAGSGLADAAG